MKALTKAIKYQLAFRKLRKATRKQALARLNLQVEKHNVR